VAIVEPGSCFSGTLAEIVFACDRSYMLAGKLNGSNVALAALTLAEANFGAYPMPNGLSRLESRFLNDPAALDVIDWNDEIRIVLEERASMSPDALTGMEANLRFGVAETMETRVFGRLSAWQNWIFIRPNAVGEGGALKVFGTGNKARFNWERV